MLGFVGYMPILLAGKVRAHARVRWLRQNDVLPPGITTLTRLVARERKWATREPQDTSAALISPQLADGAGGAARQEGLGAGAQADRPLAAVRLSARRSTAAASRRRRARRRSSRWIWG